MIIRGPRKERNFTIIDNAALDDGRLSYKARGLYCFVMSKPEQFSISAEALADLASDGRRAVLSGLKELEDAGYLQRSVDRRDDGTIVTISVLHELPPECGFGLPVPPAQTDVSAGHTGSLFCDVGKPHSKDLRTDVQELQESSHAGLHARIGSIEDHPYPEVLADLDGVVPAALLTPDYCDKCAALTEGTGVYWDVEMRRYSAWLESRPPNRRHRNVRRGFLTWLQTAIGRDAYRKESRAFKS